MVASGLGVDVWSRTLKVSQNYIGMHIAFRKWMATTIGAAACERFMNYDPSKSLNLKFNNKCNRRKKDHQSTHNTLKWHNNKLVLCVFYTQIKWLNPSPTNRSAQHAIVGIWLSFSGDLNCSFHCPFLGPLEFLSP